MAPMSINNDRSDIPETRDQVFGEDAENENVTKGDDITDNSISVQRHEHAKTRDLERANT
jgi:hypothetical protein